MPFNAHTTSANANLVLIQIVIFIFCEKNNWNLDLKPLASQLCSNYENRHYSLNIVAPLIKNDEHPRKVNIDSYLNKRHKEENG